MQPSNAAHILILFLDVGDDLNLELVADFSDLFATCKARNPGDFGNQNKDFVFKVLKEDAEDLDSLHRGVNNVTGRQRR